ncbi:MAG TPA: hypothetical protein VEA99_10785 [Gemmatimonadaceae bacterium]|nr:hypothetical protein [Gemmatimonadaceae bacterium]
MTEPSDLRYDTVEHPDDAAYAWWRSTHPAGVILAISAKQPPMLHRASCPEVDRDRHPGRLKAAGRRQICAESPTALRGWVARELPGASPVLARCPKCSP